ncbi:MAG: L-aspartate oxidase [Hyphomicrobiaceae bacterium]|nr:L-aspartate oxidase [Hyphomicrobiaceae bacterium]
MDTHSPANPIVIIGAGLAGLFTALKLAPHPVTVVAAAPLGEGASSAWAQGGIAAAVGDGDTAEAHARDTVAAGAGVVDAQVAMAVAQEAGERVRDLLGYGVPFDKDLAGRLVLSREAAHSAQRIVRVAGDRAGKAIMEALIATVRQTPSIQVIEGFTAIDLTTVGTDGRVGGVILASAEAPERRFRLDGLSAVVLATGGLGALYALTTNPPNSRGAGIAMGARVGAVVADAEFVQFHPTAIDVGADPAPLATEALRGEGAVLVNRNGERFMVALHPDAELAPRDVVAQGVFREIKAGRGAFLDCRDAVGAEFPDRFPTVYQRCMQAGIDPVTMPIPVAPAEHYHMGGLKTDTHGRTSVAGLWAVGEVAATGLHGANRLASNSLLEAVVYGARAAKDIASQAGVDALIAPQGFARLPDAPLADDAVRGLALRLIRKTMTELVGVERNGDELRRAVETLQRIETEARDDLELQNSALTARFVAEAALRRKESRGAHFRSDYPQPEPDLARRRTMTLAGLNLRNPKAMRAALGAVMVHNEGNDDGTVH